MNVLSRDKQTEIIAALCEGVGQRAVSRLTGTDRKTVARLALAVGRGAAELHDRMMSAFGSTASNATSCGPMSATSAIRRIANLRARL